MKSALKCRLYAFKAAIYYMYQGIEPCPPGPKPGMLSITLIHHHILSSAPTPTRSMEVNKACRNLAVTALKTHLTICTNGTLYETQTRFPGLKGQCSIHKLIEYSTSKL